MLLCSHWMVEQALQDVPLETASLPFRALPWQQVQVSDRTALGMGQEGFFSLEALDGMVIGWAC